MSADEAVKAALKALGIPPRNSYEQVLMGLYEAGRQSVHDDQAAIAERILGELENEPRDDRALVFIDPRPVRRLLAEYHSQIEPRLCGSLRDQDLWISEAADLLERIAGDL